MIALTEKEILQARTGKKILDEDLGLQSADAELVLHNSKDTRISLPKSAVMVISEVLTFLSEGREVEVTAVDEELTTQKAGDYLRVSRPYLIKLLETGEIPYRKIGKHRRILSADLRAYKRKVDENRLRVLDELSAQAQDLEMGY